MSKENLTRAQVRERYLALEKKRLFDQHVDPIDMSIVIPVTKDYHYYPVSFTKRLKRRLRYDFVVRPFMGHVNGRLLETTVVGKGNLRGLKSAMVISNHVHMFDCLALKKAMAPHYLNIVAASFNNFTGSLGESMRASGMLPLPESYDGMAHFEEALETSFHKNHFVLFYPEQAEWWYYHKLRPFKDGAFHYALKYNVPIVPCFITFAPRKRPYKNSDGDYPERIIVHILKPLFPDQEADFKTERERLKSESWNECKECYENTYEIPLSYEE